MPLCLLSKIRGCHDARSGFGQQHVKFCPPELRETKVHPKTAYLSELERDNPDVNDRNRNAGLSKKQKEILEDHRIKFSNHRGGHGQGRPKEANVVSRTKAARQNAMYIGILGSQQAAKKNKIKAKKETESLEEEDDYFVVDDRVEGTSSSGRSRDGLLAKMGERFKIDHEALSRIRRHSRVGRALFEFGTGDDWVSRSLLAHYIASILQAHWRGYRVRAQYSDKISKAVKAAKSNQEQQMPGNKHSILKNGLDAIKGHDAGLLHRRSSGKWMHALRHAGKTDDDSDSRSSSSFGSDWSDLDLEELEVLKYRASTPPWQRQEDARWSGIQAKLSYQPLRGNLDVLWDQVDCHERIDKVRGRRSVRCPKDEQGDEEYDPSLPAELINDMLLDRYLEKYERMGLVASEKI